MFSSLPGTGWAEEFSIRNQSRRRRIYLYFNLFRTIEPKYNLIFRSGIGNYPDIF
jgi:hypothetical protein